MQVNSKNDHLQADCFYIQEEGLMRMWEYCWQMVNAVSQRNQSSSSFCAQHLSVSSICIKRRSQFDICDHFIRFQSERDREIEILYQHSLSQRA